MSRADHLELDRLIKRRYLDNTEITQKFKDWHNSNMEVHLSLCVMSALSGNSWGLLVLFWLSYFSRENILLMVWSVLLALKFLVLHQNNVHLSSWHFVHFKQCFCTCMTSVIEGNILVGSSHPTCQCNRPGLMIVSHCNSQGLFSG